MKLLDRLVPLRLLPSPSEELAALSLRQVRVENAFCLHLATWVAGSAFVAAMTAATGFEDPGVLSLIIIWGAGVGIHGWSALVHRRRRHQRRHSALAEDRRRRAAQAAEDQGAGLLRRKLLHGAEAARAVLRKLSPDTVAEVSRGETEALAAVAWLLEAEPLLTSRRLDPGLRLDVAKRLSEPVAPEGRQRNFAPEGRQRNVALEGGQRKEVRHAREPLERLLNRLDFHDSQLARLERGFAERKTRVESFLLAIENVRIASAESSISPVVSASICERVARLESAQADESVEQAAARMREEVRLARELQRSILPEQAPRLDGLQVAHAYRPSSEVGGDFYDFYAPAPGRLLIALGDASGHGLDAAMVSSMAKSALYLQVSARRDLAAAMTEINRMMCDTLGRRRMMTLALLEIDVEHGTLAWVNAGQLYPMLIRDRRVHELEQPSYPLGVRRDNAYAVHRESLEAGDRLILLTDGYVEATGEAGEPFGWNRLVERLADLGGEGLEDTIDLLLADLTDFLGPASPRDDVTLIAIRHEPKA